jgi:hypothetical protein
MALSKSIAVGPKPESLQRSKLATAVPEFGDVLNVMTISVDGLVQKVAPVPAALNTQ